MAFQPNFSDMVNALIATEDARFYKHSGVDVRALGRAISGALSGREKEAVVEVPLHNSWQNAISRENLNKIELILRKFKEDYCC